MSRILLMCAGLAFASGIALADADDDLSNPSTTGTEAMEQSSSDDLEAGRGGLNDRTDAAGNKSGLGTMGTGATGTTGGMGATTGTDTIGDRDDEAEQ